MRSFLAVTAFATFASAVEVDRLAYQFSIIPTLNIDRVYSEAECEALNPPGGVGYFHYTYDQETCTCFYTDDIYTLPSDCVLPTPHVNPLAGPNCISNADYNAIYNHSHQCVQRTTRKCLTPFSFDS